MPKRRASSSAPMLSQSRRRRCRSCRGDEDQTRKVAPPLSPKELEPITNRPASVMSNCRRIQPAIAVQGDDAEEVDRASKSKRQPPFSTRMVKPALNFRTLRISTLPCKESRKECGAMPRRVVPWCYLQGAAGVDIEDGKVSADGNGELQGKAGIGAGGNLGPTIGLEDKRLAAEANCRPNSMRRRLVVMRISRSRCLGEAQELDGAVDADAQARRHGQAGDVWVRPVVLTAKLALPLNLRPMSPPKLAVSERVAASTSPHRRCGDRGGAERAERAEAHRRVDGDFQPAGRDAEGERAGELETSAMVSLPESLKSRPGAMVACPPQAAVTVAQELAVGADEERRHRLVLQ